MKKHTLFVIATIMVSMASFAQQPNNKTVEGKLSSVEITTFVRTLKAQIPDIFGATSDPDEFGENYFRCDMEDLNLGNTTLQVYRYCRPASTADLALVAYNVHDDALGSWLKCFSVERKNSKATEIELPFKLLPASQFDKEEFDKDHSYWRIGYTIFNNGDVLIAASPGMAWNCLMLVHWDEKGNFRTFRRAGYDFMNVGITPENAETEKYAQEVIRPNFQRINEIKQWAYVEEKEVFDISLEGAMLTFYYSDNGLEKVIAKIYGETFKSLIEYYFLDGHLSFIYDVTTRYGIPPMYREELLSQGHEDVPDTKIERRWYLKGNNCIRGLGDSNKKLTPAQIEEEFANTGNGVFSFYMSIMGF